MSNYRVTITHIDGAKVNLAPGSPEETDFIDAIVKLTVAKGLGVFKTEAQIKKNLTEATREVILKMKRAVQPN